MSDILFTCWHCSAHLAVDDSEKGRTLDCTECGKPVKVPEQAVRFDCPACSWGLSAPRTLVGMTFQCPQCDGPVVIPSPIFAHAHQPKSAQVCPSCGAALGDGDRLCVACGLDLASGTKLPPA